MLRPNRDNLADAVAAGELAADNGLRIRHSQCLTVQAQIHIGLGNRTPALRAAQTAVQIQRTAGALALLAHTQELVNRLEPARTHTADQPRQRKCCLG